MITTDTAIAVNDLEKSYNSIKVLKGIHFTAKRDSVFALLGSNGAGKTTTIKILTTLLRPDKGSAQVCGFDVVRQPDRVRESISLTGQFAAVDDVLTGRENLLMIVKLRHLPDARKKADELLERFQLQDAADRRVATYSGGMRRRLDLAMSLAGNPLVLFLDEPTAGLDPQSRMSMWKIVRDLARSGVTVFLSTQYLEEADQLADRIAILNEGKIVAAGTAAELKKLLPRGHLELEFHDEKAARSGRDLLAAYSPNLSVENQTLTIAANGSIKQMADILDRLEKAGLSVAGFSQKQPTLENVFLAIVSARQEREHAQ